jgi:eukaryotic-like serine/threonine-protein kinase
MKHPQSRLFIAAAILLAACAVQVAPVAPTQAVPQLGDVRTRAADGMPMLYVPSGEFTMGSDREMAAFGRRLCWDACGDLAIANCRAAAFYDEQPAHVVWLRSLWIDRTEVTNGQYRTCVAAGACVELADRSSFTRQSYYDNPAFLNYPVVNVDWNMASAYCEWAGARLPSEAEWEYSARGPESRIFPWGDAFDKTKVNYCDARCAGLADSSHDDGYPDTSPVGAFPEGETWVGAMDMAGNVREWASDWLAPYSHGAVKNPGGPDTGEMKIPKGGSWYDTPDNIRSANRGGEVPDYFRHNLGFRCASDG